MSVKNAALTGAISISGRVTLQDGTAVGGVSVTLAGSSQSVVTTDAGGGYSFPGLNVGSFAVRPSKEGCSFSPDVVNLNNLAVSKTQDFVASGDGCQASSPDNPVAWTDGSFNLVANRNYAAGTWKDDEGTVPQPVRITVPATLPVTIGNAGTGSATLSYWVSWGEVRCEYRGGSSVAHPTTPVQIAEGQEYRLQYCWDGAQGGAERLVSRVKLHIQEGDGADPAHFTEVRVQLGGVATLEPALSRAQSVALREGFLWENTTALPEISSEGKDSLWYALIYVESKEEMEALKWLYIHHDTLPLFNAELTRWGGRVGVFRNQGDGVGTWVHAVIPGITYNKVRQAALDGDEIFRAIVLRQPPADARNADGSLSYRALTSSAFVYEADLSIVVPDDGATLSKPSATTGTLGQASLAKRRGGLRGLIRAIGNAVKGVVQGVQQVMGAVDRWVNGSVQLTVALDVLNTDPTFGKDRTFQRAWGAGRGGVAKLPGVRIEVRQMAPLGLVTLFTGRTGADGATTIKVGRYRDSAVCMDIENDAAIVSEWLFPKRVCNFSAYPASSLANDRSSTWRLGVSDVNILMQATEGRAYLTNVVGHTPPKAEIMVGSLADLIGMINGDRAFTPCLGFRNAGFDRLIAQVNALVMVLPTVGPALSATLMTAKAIYGSTDIVFPAATSYGVESQISRGVVTHEYGHFALCSMMDEIGPYVLANAYTEAMLAALTADTGPASYLNESFADFFTGQVAGGTNYFGAGWYRERLGIKYCSATQVCLDTNKSGSGDYYENIGRVATTLHDAFDGQSTGGNVPGNADVWDMSKTPWEVGTASGAADSHDEPVALAGAQLRGMLGRWSQRASTLTETGILGGLSDAMSDSGYSWCDRCKVFALHDPTQPATDRQKYDVCQTAPISSWIGAAPDRTDPDSCLFAEYFQGCRNAGAYLCDELVDPSYFWQHPGCTRHEACLGQYEACSAVCPVPTAEEVPNVVVKAAGVPAVGAQIVIGYIWNAGGTGGYHSAQVASQPWAELQIGAGVHAPAGDALLYCAANESGHGVASVDVRWKNGATQSLSCGGTSCWQTVAVNEGFTATCNFDTL